MVDFPHVLRQLGVDPLGGYGWEVYDAKATLLDVGDAEVL